MQVFHVMSGHCLAVMKQSSQIGQLIQQKEPRWAVSETVAFLSLFPASSRTSFADPGQEVQSSGMGWAQMESLSGRQVHVLTC